MNKRMNKGVINGGDIIWTDGVDPWIIKQYSRLMAYAPPMYDWKILENLGRNDSIEIYNDNISNYVFPVTVKEINLK